MITDAQRRLFDSLLDEVIAALPQKLHDLMEELPLIVEDRPSRLLLDEMGIDSRYTDLCGLHQGIDLMRKSVEHSGVLPDRMMLFREPIMRLAGRGRVALGGESSTGPLGPLRRGAADRQTDALREQIRITLLHEIGHHFGLDEDDLDALGYG